MAETSQAIYQTSIPEELIPFAQKLLGQAQAFTDIEKYPYQQYQGERVAQFSPLQQQAMETAGQMGVAGQVGAATDIAGAAGLSALGTQYDPMRYRTQSFTQPGAAGAYMSPFMQNVVDVQQREAKRQADIAATARGAQAARAGAFGGSRQAIENAEANRALQTQLGGIQATGLQSAFQQAQQQFNQEQANRLQAQQMGEQSRQFGAGLGMTGIQNALQSANILGTLGQQQTAQTQQAIQTQAALGQMEQQRAQDILNAQYQDFQAYQNYPYRNLSFMSDILRGVPTSQSAATMYQSPPNMLGQLAGLGIGAYGASQAFPGLFGLPQPTRAKGGMVSSYADGGSVQSYDDGGSVIDGSVLSQYNKDAIVHDLHPMGLPRAMQGAVARGDRETTDAVQDEMNIDAAIRRGIAAAAPDSIATGYADGGIVAFANGGDKGEYFKDPLGAPDYEGGDLSLRKLFGQTVREGETYTPGLRGMLFGYDVLPREEKQTAKTDESLRYDPATATRLVDYQTPKKIDTTNSGIKDAVKTMAVTHGLSEDRMMEVFDKMRDKLSAENKPIFDKLDKLEERQSSRAEKLRAQAPFKALMEYGFNLAAEASKPGQARGRGIMGAIASASAAAPTFTASMAESNKAIEKAEDTYNLLQMENAKYRLAMKKGDSATAMQHATNMRQLEISMRQLEVQAKHYAQQAAYQQAALSQRGEQFGQLMGVREKTAAAQLANAETQRRKLESVARQKFESDVAPRLNREFASKYGKNWDKLPDAQADFQRRKREYISGQSEAGGATPFSSLLDMDNSAMKFIFGGD